MRPRLTMVLPVLAFAAAAWAAHQDPVRDLPDAPGRWADEHLAPEALLAQARERMAQGDTARAYMELRRATRAVGVTAALMLEIGRCELALGDLQAAEHAFQRVLAGLTEDAIRIAAPDSDTDPVATESTALLHLAYVERRRLANLDKYGSLDDPLDVAGVMTASDGNRAAQAAATQVRMRQYLQEALARDPDNATARTMLAEMPHR